MMQIIAFGQNLGTVNTRKKIFKGKAKFSYALSPMDKTIAHDHSLESHSLNLLIQLVSFFVLNPKTKV